MKSDTPARRRLVLLFLPVLLLAPLAALAEDTAAPGSKSIVAALQPFVDNGSLAGAVTLVADKNKILSLDAVGFADVEARKPMKTDALFWIASQSKPITAAALMILVDEGKVKLDDPAEKYLPELKELRVMGKKGDNPASFAKPKHPPTVRQLLSHTSGMPFSSAKETPTLDGLSLEDAVKSYAATPLLHEPGTGYRYSNAGINTAGRIIEVVSGMPYESFLDKRLFGPLGMKDTTFWPDESQVARLAKSYIPDGKKTGLEATLIGQLRYPLSDRKRHPMPAGGLFSTARDVGRFCQMVLNKGEFEGKRYLSEAAVKEMTSKQTGDTLEESYGLGWSVGGNGFSHGGAFATNMSVDTRRGLIAVWMVQHAGFPLDGSKSQGAFRKAAEDKFGAKK
jgi:CubicO group peptidase (beta-lactamase class C family)